MRERKRKKKSKKRSSPAAARGDNLALLAGRDTVVARPDLHDIAAHATAVAHAAGLLCARLFAIRRGRGWWSGGRRGRHDGLGGSRVEVTQSRFISRLRYMVNKVHVRRGGRYPTSQSPRWRRFVGTNGVQSIPRGVASLYSRCLGRFPYAGGETRCCRIRTTETGTRGHLYHVLHIFTDTISVFLQ